MTVAAIIQFIVLPLVAAIFGWTLHFFIKSRKTLQETLKGTNKATASVEPKKGKKTGFKTNHILELEKQFAKSRLEVRTGRNENIDTSSSKISSKDTVSDLKNTITQQQKMLDSYLLKVEELENEGRQELNKQITDLERRIDQLHAVVEEKDEEIKELSQQASAGQRMAAKIEEVYREFDQLQTKMDTLEKQANRANNLAIELEDTKFAYEQIHKELLRKHEKLEDIMEENQRMRKELDEVEDKLSEANLQRQQLQKKVQFLTDLNGDMQGIADTNKKLQTELRRIGELESMLNMMAEERDFLLRKKTGK